MKANIARASPMPEPASVRTGPAEIAMSPFLLQRGEHGIDAGNVLDVAWRHPIDAERLRQRLDPLAERLALVGEGEIGALRVKRFGNTPGDRMIIGDAHDQPALA